MNAMPMRSWTAYDPGWRALTVLDESERAVLDDVSFDIRPGEILGIAGVQGNGQTELAEGIATVRATREAVGDDVALMVDVGASRAELADLLYVGGLLATDGGIRVPRRGGRR